jgi:peptide methionine sulfoxide reductase msrA/msrB
MKLLKIFTILALLTPFNSQAKMEKENYEIATFAGGCFWCMQPVFDELDGVIETYVGYSGGSRETANYETVSNKNSNHFEAIEIKYDPKKITYKTLLEKFIRNIDPTDPLGQFADKGPQYLTAVFYHNETQKKKAEEFFADIEKKNILDGEIKTKIIPYKNFFKAEEYHQDYYKKNPMHYNGYKYGSGRVSKLKEIWGDL